MTTPIQQKASVADPPTRKSVEDWYNEVDVSVSSTGSEIRNRLQASLNVYPSPKNLQDAFSPVQYDDGLKTAAYAMNTPQMACLTEEESRHVPSWISRNPQLAYLYKPAGEFPQLPASFFGAHTPVSAWTIPDPVLYGLRRPGTN